MSKERPDYCIFCGESLKSGDDNREHVYPQWLVDRCGMKCHEWQFAIPDRSEQSGIEIRNHRYGSFINRIHAECNYRFNVLYEVPAQKAVEKIFQDKDLESGDLLALSRWLDKQRAAVALSKIFMSRHAFVKEKPEWFVEDWIQSNHTISWIYKTGADRPALNSNLGRVQFYHHMPFIFGLNIHNYNIITFNLAVSVNAIYDEAIRHLNEFSLEQSIALTMAHGSEVKYYPQPAAAIWCPPKTVKQSIIGLEYPFSIKYTSYGDQGFYTETDKNLLNIDIPQVSFLDEQHERLYMNWLIERLQVRGIQIMLVRMKEKWDDGTRKSAESLVEKVKPVLDFSFEEYLKIVVKH